MRARTLRSRHMTTHCVLAEHRQGNDDDDELAAVLLPRESSGSHTHANKEAEPGSNQRTLETIQSMTGAT